MNVDTFVRELEDLGVRLWEEGGKLRFRAPSGVLTDERREVLRAHKDAVLASLRGGSAIVPDSDTWYEPFPLTDVQAAYLIGRNRGLPFGGVGCHAYGELRFDEMDPGRLDAAWRRLIDRHAMLRAIVLPRGGQQVLGDVPAYTIAVTDLRGTGGAEAARARAAIRATMDHRVYDPAAWPLFDLHLSRGDRESRLHISIDFLIADYVSIFVLLGELRQLYDRPDVALTPPTLTFRDYLLASHARRNGAAYERDRAYWLNRLADFPAAPELPVREAAAAETSHVRFRRWELTIDAAAWGALAQQAAARGLTRSTAVLAAYAEVLGRWSRRQRFAVDLTLLNRPSWHPELGRVVGDFTSISLLEVDHRRPATFADRARLLQQQLGADLEHRLCSGIEVIRELARTQGSRGALMPVVFTSALGLPEIGGESPLGEFAGGISQTPQVWLDCQAMERAGHLSVNWDVREGVFPDGYIDTLFGAFESVLSRLADGSAVWDEMCPVPLPIEQAARRQAANATATDRPTGTLLSGVLAWAARAPGRVCLLSPTVSMTYAEVSKRAGGLQDTLIRAGVGPGDLVGVLVEKGPLQVIGALGVLLAGAAYLPIDEGEPPSRRNEILADARVRVVLVSDTVADLPGVRAIDVRQVPPSVSTPGPVPTSPSALAYVIYTSGSTGRPKGVMITHQAALNTVCDINRRFGIADDRVLCVSSLAFDLSVYDIFGMLDAGGAMVFPAPERRSDPSHWFELVAQYQITIWNSVPAIMGMLERYAASQPTEGLASLRTILLSGDWVPVELVKRLRQRLPAATLMSLGGATEGSIWSIYFPIAELSAEAAVVPYGRPLANHTIHVVDEAMRPCPDGVTGEICIGGDGVALGYLHDDDRTAERFVEGRYGEGRLYRTGDLGRYLADGNVEILGREDAQVKIRGHRVELGEIEAAIEAHPSISRAAAIVSGGDAEHRRVLAFAEAATATPPSSVDVAAAGLQASAAFFADADGSSFATYAAALDRAALAGIVAAIRRVGLDGPAGWRSEEMADALGAGPKYAALLQRWVGSLREHDLVEVDGNRYRLTAAAKALDLPAAWQSVDEVAGSLDSSLLLDYFRTCNERLLDLVRGEQAALQALYPQGRSDVAASLHERSYVNRWANQALGAMGEAVAASSDAGRSLRVLEIGAGTGGTTAALLAGFRRPVEYHFTDVSQYFLNGAAERFREYPGIRFARFDIDLPYRDQGLAPNSFDLIVAGDVVHAARNASQSLAGLAELLRPGGWLLASEMTRDHCQILTSLELLNVAGDEEARYEDERRATGRTFYTTADWTRLLESSGACSVALLPSADHPFAAIGLCVFAAQFKTDRANVGAEELLAFLAERLPEYMVPSRLQVVDRLPLSANGKIDRKQLHDWEIQLVDRRQAAPQSFDNELVGRVAAIWNAVLGNQSTDADIDFFAAGGDSLLAAQLAGRVLEELPEARTLFFDDLLRMLLEGPTLNALASAVERGAIATTTTTESITPEVAAPSVPVDEREIHVLVHDDTTSVDSAGLSDVLAVRYRVAQRLASSAISVPAQAAEILASLGPTRATVGHCIGMGRGSLVAIELARQLLERTADGRPPGVTLVMPPAMTGAGVAGAVPAYAGDLTLIAPADVQLEAFWRSICLGDVRVERPDPTNPASLAQIILGPAT